MHGSDLGFRLKLPAAGTDLVKTEEGRVKIDNMENRKKREKIHETKS